MHLVQENELLLDDININADNILNVVSGRISTKRLDKILRHYDIYESTSESDDLDEENKAEDEYISKQVVDHDKKGVEYQHGPSVTAGSKRKSTLLSYQNDSNENPPFLISNSNIFEGRSNDSKSINRTLDQPEKYTQTNFSSQDKKDVSDVLSELKPEATEMLTDTRTDNENNQKSKALHPTQSVDQLLKDIRDLREAKKNSIKLPDIQPTRMIRQAFNTKLEQKLGQLLSLIMDDTIESTSDFKENLKIVVKNIDKLQGTVIDGHLKTNLLYQFLKEFKKIEEEKQELQTKETDLSLDPFMEEQGGSGYQPGAYGYDKDLNTERRFFEDDMPTQQMSPYSRDKGNRTQNKGFMPSVNNDLRKLPPPPSQSLKNKLNVINTKSNVKHTEASFRRKEETMMKKESKGGVGLGKGKGNTNQVKNSVKNEKWIGKKTEADISDEDMWVSIK